MKMALRFQPVHNDLQVKALRRGDHYARDRSMILIYISIFNKRTVDLKLVHLKTF